MGEKHAQPALATAAIDMLPEGYRTTGSIDLSRRPSIALAFNALACGNPPFGCA